jgi:histone deacetylase 1/2
METYSLTPQALCVKTVVVVAVERDWELRQLDVNQAFIPADLNYDVYTKLLDGCGDNSGEKVKLNKAVCDLKQARRQWSSRLTQVLVEKVGMEQCKADPCVFRLRIDGETTMVLCVHVDDNIVGEESEVCDALYASLLQ